MRTRIRRFRRRPRRTRARRSVPRRPAPARRLRPRRRTRPRRSLPPRPARRRPRIRRRPVPGVRRSRVRRPRVIRPVVWVSNRPWLPTSPLPATQVVVRTPASRTRSPRPLPGPQAIHTQARRALDRAGMLQGIWASRLAQASPDLVRFINRFHRVTGFQHVVQDRFGVPARQARARLAQRLAHRLANRDPNFARRMAFQRVLGMALGGHPLVTVDVLHRGRRHRLLPWPQLHPRAVQQQLLRDMALAAGPGRVVWVFDGRRLNVDRSTLLASLRRALRDPRSPLARHPALPAWLARLPRMVQLLP